MKWPRTKQTSTEGMLYVEKMVNDHGSIFRRVHQEEDVGIDGFIEIVQEEEVSGKLVAVQIKSGESFLSSDHSEFEVPVDERHLYYWKNFMVPVLLVCYSPTLDVAAWISVRDYIERAEYYGESRLTKISIPTRRRFDVEALSKSILGLANIQFDERTLIRFADKCLSFDAVERQEGFFVLSQHPTSRNLRVVCMFAKMLLMDVNIDTAKQALHALGYGVGRFRWSSQPGNRFEAEVMGYASELCGELSEAEIRRLVELIDDEHFSGPDGLGERCFDVLCCCFDKASDVLYSIAKDKDLPLVRRSNALYLLYECDDDNLQEAKVHLQNDADLADVYLWMYGA